MITNKQSLNGKVSQKKQSIIGKLNYVEKEGSDFRTQEKEVNPTRQIQEVVADEGYDGLSKVKVQPIPNEYIIPTGTKQISITQNGITTEDVINYTNAEITTNVVNQDYEDALVAFGVEKELTNGIEALTTYSNEVTGESDTTLSDAVRTLADGFGYGGAIYLYASKHITANASYGTFNNFKDAVVPDLPLDKTFVLIEFVNNTTTSRSGIYWMQTITPETYEVKSAGARVGAGFGGEYGCDVHAGATINIYVGEHGALPDELYSIWTDIISRYLGRNMSNGQGLFTPNSTISSTTGEVIAGDNAVCEAYLPVDESYSYIKSGSRIYGIWCYDENKNYLGNAGQMNNLTYGRPLPKFIPGTRYIRVATHNVTNNWVLQIYRVA